MNRTAVLRYLKKRGDRLIGMNVGSGMFFRYAEVNDIDFVCAISASRFRQMGVNSLASCLPYGNANEIVYDFAAREILPRSPRMPIIFGLCATDPTICMEDYLARLRSSGFSGVCNLPSINSIDGQLNAALAREGYSYRQEVEAIAIAHRLDLFTIGMVQDAQQAQEMIAAGCDAVCVHFGAAKGGVLGARLEMTIKEAAELANQVFEVCRGAERSILKLFYGGPARTPPSVRFIQHDTGADGFIGGYSIERLFVEKNLGEGAIRRAFFDEEEIKITEQKADYAEYVKSYVEQKYREKITVNDLANILHISRPYLSQIIIRELGEPLTEYLTAFRLEKASNMLINTSVSVASVASLVGYKDYMYFSKAFKKRMGLSPFNYRKLYKNT